MNIDTIKAYHDAIWGQKDIQAIEQYFLKDAMIHSPVKSTRGTDEMKAIITQWYEAFPDLQVQWDDYICDESKVVARWHAKGHQRGEFLGLAATNHPVHYQGMTIYQLKDQKIEEYWALVDMYSIIEQIRA